MNKNEMIKKNEKETTTKNC